MEDPLAEEILLGKFLANDTTVVVDPDSESGIVFRKGSPLGLEGDFGTTVPVEEAPQEATLGVSAS